MTEIKVHKRDLIVYKDKDRESVLTGPDAGKYFDSGALAYTLAGYLRPAVVGSPTEGVGTLMKDRGRFIAQSKLTNPKWDLPVVYSFRDGYTFEEVYTFLTARGELTTIGHGSAPPNNGLWLDGELPVSNPDAPWWDGFKIKGTANGPNQNAPYPLPYLGVHGVSVKLYHCHSGEGTMPEQLHSVLTNNGSGVGNGVVTGVLGMFTIQFRTGWTGHHLSMPDFYGSRSVWAFDAFQNYSEIYENLNLAAKSHNVHLATLAQGGDEEWLQLRTRGWQISGSQSWLPLRVTLEMGFPSGSGPYTVGLWTGPPVLNGTPADTFTYEHVGIGAGPTLWQVSGLSPQSPGNYTVTIEDYGNLAYFVRFMAHIYPIEEAGKGGRLERFDSDLLGKIPVQSPAGGFADNWNHVWLSFSQQCEIRCVGP